MKRVDVICIFFVITVGAPLSAMERDAESKAVFAHLQGVLSSEKEIKLAANDRLSNAQSEGIEGRCVIGNHNEDTEGMIDILTWSPCGGYLASASSGVSKGTIKIWDVSEGTLLRILKFPNPLINAISWSPQGVSFAACGGSISEIWDTKKQWGSKRFTLGQDEVLSLDWGSDRRILTGSRAGKITVWLPELAQEEYIFKGHIMPGADCTRTAVTAIACRKQSDADTVVASCSADGTIQCWDLATKKTLYTFRGLIGPKRVAYWTSLVWSPCGSRLAAASNAARVVVLNTQPWSSRVVEWEFLRYGPISVEFYNSNELAIVSQGVTQFWDIHAKLLCLCTQVSTHEDSLDSPCVKWNPRRTCLALISGFQRVGLQRVERVGGSTIEKLKGLSILQK